MGTNPPRPAYDRAELDRQYDARGTVPDVEALLRDYAEASAGVYAQLEAIRDIAYGDGPDERLDLFPVPGAGVPVPVFLFIHGGYWRALSKEDSVFMAEAFVRRDIAFVAIDYTLAPAASLDRIVAQVRTAITWCHHRGADYGLDPTRLHVAGTSAGGHLTGMVLAGGWHAAFGVPETVIASASAVSGLFDLEPLPATRANSWLGLDAVSAERLSPLRHLPRVGCPLLLSYGGSDTDEFKRQSLAYGNAWTAAGFPAQVIEVQHRNHFDILFEWCDARSPLFRAVAALILRSV